MGNESGDETRNAIMDATYRALCSHGYAALTMQDVAEELGKSTSLLHYHFDTKRDMLLAFIDHLLEEFERAVDTFEGSPDDRLADLLDWFVFDPDDERAAVHVALVELRAQAPHDDAYREGHRRADELVRRSIAEIVRDGVDEGVFRADVDPDAVSRLVVATMDGARTRQITLGEPAYAAAVRDALVEHVVDGLRTTGEE